MSNLLITGGAGFIGSHVVSHFVSKYPNVHVINLDKLTYAADLSYLAAIEKRPNYTFIRGDINDPRFVEALFERHKISSVIHLAAESHVDRSIQDPEAVIYTNVLGTVHLLNAAKRFWDFSKREHRFYHISTDEVFGTLGDDGYFTEETPYSPRSPYSASKASSDLIVKAYINTFKLPAVISNCSNNYGPHQHLEKLIPMTIRNIIDSRPIPIYGTGQNVRDWLFVRDHVEAIDQIYHNGRLGESYLIGGENEWKNIDLVKLLAEIMDHKLGKAQGTSGRLITLVNDRPGHDERYAIDCSKTKRELHWAPKTDFRKGLEETVDWYLERLFSTTMRERLYV